MKPFKPFVILFVLCAALSPTAYAHHQADHQLTPTEHLMDHAQQHMDEGKVSGAHKVSGVNDGKNVTVTVALQK